MGIWMADQGGEQRYLAARRWLPQVGAIVLSYFQGAHLERVKKHDGTDVTKADREAEAYLRKMISQEFPQDSITGEESGETLGSSGWRWIVDPIDGTAAFVQGVPLFGTLIGATFNDQPLIGVIAIHALGESVFALKGQGAWWIRNKDAEPVRCHVSSQTQLSDAAFCYTTVKSWDQCGAGKAHEKLRQRVSQDRGWSDCYGYVLVATGRADIMVDAKMHIWDNAALMPIIEEAGGRFTDWNGRSVIDGGNAVASNGVLHDFVLKLLSED